MPTVSDIQRTVDNMLKAYGRDEAMTLALELLEIDQQYKEDVGFWQSVYDILQITTFKIECVEANKFKVIWYVPPEAASLKVIK